jgi:hypothetical protein
MSFSFAWNWDSQPELNSPPLNSPIPCRWGSKCYYNECCRFVHPGEEGTGRMLFPGRYSEYNGKSTWEPPIVRLIGHPHFYERRRLHLSWPQWCAKKGLTVPCKPDHIAIEVLPENGMKHMLNEAYETERQKIGHALYPKVSLALNEGKDELIKNDMWLPKITPYNIVMNILDKHPVVYLQKLVNNGKEIGKQMADACVDLFEGSDERMTDPINDGEIYNI